jgi:hypothetical protein
MQPLEIPVRCAHSGFLFKAIQPQASLGITHVIPGGGGYNPWKSLFAALTVDFYLKQSNLKQAWVGLL